MAIKGYPTSTGSGSTSLTGTNVDLTAGAITSHSGTIAANDSDLRTRLWSELVTRDAREKNVFEKFIGGEGSGKPIVEKQDLSAGGSDKVTFTTVAPIRGQGVRGEEVLKNNTGSLSFGTFNVEVDLIRHAVSWTQVLKLMRFTGKTLDQLSAEVMSEWAARMEQDLIQDVIRDTCLQEAGNNLLSDYGANSGNAGLKYTEGLSTDIIQEAKQALIANGGQPMNTGGDVNQEIPGYLFFAPDACLRPLRSDPDYLEAITQADARSADNKLYSGSYAKWDNNIIANHNVIIDTAHGRQGSPLAPVAVMPAGLGSGSVNGWDASSANMNQYTIVQGDSFGATDTDLFANFPGATYTVPGGGGVKHVQRTGSDFSLLFVDANKNYCAFNIDEFRTGSVTGGSSHVKLGPQVDTTTHLTGQTVALTGPISIYLANDRGTPIGYALAMGESAMYLARGAVTNEQIFHYDDFANSGNEAHLSAVGLQSVYGMAAYQDTSGRLPGVVLVEAVRQVPGLSLASQPDI